jgi:hypothetical protein
MFILNLGAILFGVVIGWVTHKILARQEKPTWADLTAVLGAVAGAAVLALFPAQTILFGWYAIGLFCGFFLYFVIWIVLARRGGIEWKEIVLGLGDIHILKSPGSKPPATKP